MKEAGGFARMRMSVTFVNMQLLIIALPSFVLGTMPEPRSITFLESKAICFF